MLKKVKAKFGDPYFARKIHGWGTFLWFIASLPLAIAFGNLVIFVTWISLYAIVVCHWTAWQEQGTNIEQKKQDKKLAEALDDYSAD